MALGLLVEVAYEHDEEFRQHLPQVGCGHRLVWASLRKGTARHNAGTVL